MALSKEHPSIYGRQTRCFAIICTQCGWLPNKVGNSHY